MEPPPKKMLVSIYSLLNPNTMDCKRSHKGLHPPANTTNMGPLNFTLPSIKRQEGDLSTDLQLGLKDTPHVEVFKHQPFIFKGKLNFYLHKAICIGLH